MPVTYGQKHTTLGIFASIATFVLLSRAVLALFTGAGLLFVWGNHVGSRDGSDSLRSARHELEGRTTHSCSPHDGCRRINLRVFCRLVASMKVRLYKNGSLACQPKLRCTRTGPPSRCALRATA